MHGLRIWHCYHGGAVFAHAVWVRMVCGVGLSIATMSERGIAIRWTDCPTCWHGWFIGTVVGMSKASLLARAPLLPRLNQCARNLLEVSTVLVHALPK